MEYSPEARIVPCPAIVEGQLLEGTVVVIAEFESMASLQIWHDSPEYAALKAKPATLTRNLFFVEGVQPSSVHL
jgi:uncharacterized protein (DUF1330 family)